MLRLGEKWFLMVFFDGSKAQRAARGPSSRPRANPCADPHLRSDGLGKAKIGQKNDRDAFSWLVERRISIAISVGCAHLCFGP